MASDHVSHTANAACFASSPVVASAWTRQNEQEKGALAAGRTVASGQVPVDQRPADGRGRGRWLRVVLIGEEPERPYERPPARLASLLRDHIVTAGKLIVAAKAGGTATVTAPGWLVMAAPCQWFAGFGP